MGARALLVVDGEALTAHVVAGVKAPPTFFAALIAFLRRDQGREPWVV